MVDHQPIMPKIDKTEAKEPAQPADFIPPPSVKKIPPKKEASKLPK